MEFAILGPIEVRVAGRALALGGPKQRALLACLLLHANEVVSRDVLLEAVWGDRPPPLASRSLDSYVSRLRAELGAERLIRRPPGLVLLVHAGELDLDRFDALTEEARASMASHEVERAATTLREALGLWRGPALADLLYEPVAAHAAGLEERRLAAVEDRIDADLACGMGRELVPELERLVAAQPLRERPLAQLMLALYRAGRHSQALAVFEAARRRLADELGLDPSPRLRELERQILRHDPSLEPVRAPARPGQRHRRKRIAVAVAASLVTAAAVAAVAILLVSRAGGDSNASPRTSAGSLLSLRPESGETTRSDDPVGVPAAITTGAGAVWVADSGNRQVLRIDPSSSRVTDRIPVDGQPSSLVSRGGAVWVASTLSGTISRIDAGTDEVTQTISLGGADAAAVAVGPAGLWAADSTDHALVRIDEATGTALRTVTLDVRPSALAVGARTLWVADHDAGRVSEVDASTGETVATVQVGGGPDALALGLGALWVANSLDATVSRINLATATVAATIPVGSGPSGLAIVHAEVWVTNQYAGTISRIDPRRNTVTTTIETDGRPIAVAGANGTLWVASSPPATSHRGGTLTIATTGRFPSIDPAFQNIASPSQFGKLAYDTLVTFPATAGAAGLRLVPDLALALPSPTNGGTTFAFRLRRGIRYSDGSAVKASDFRRAIERLFRVGSQGAAYFSGILGSGACRREPASCTLARGIRTDDAAGTVVFQLSSPDGDFLYKLTPYSYTAPVPAGTPDRDVAAAPVPGTGPYRISPWHGDEIRFERNPFFREWSHAAQPDGNPDAIVWRFYPSFEAETRAVQQGSADWIFGLLPPARLRELQLTSAAQLRENQTSYVVDFIPLNTHRPPFDDVRVRRALNLAIDRGKIVRMYGGPTAATPTCQPLPPGMLGYRRYCPYTREPRADGSWSASDLVRARQLVAASRTSGQMIDVWGATDQLGVPRQLPVYVASVLRSLGYRTRMHTVPLASISYAMRRDFQLSVDGDWLPDYPAPSGFLPQFFGCQGGYSNGYVCDPALDRQMQEASALQRRDPQALSARWADIDRTLVDHAYWVPTVISHPPELVSERLRNYQYNPIWGFVAGQAWVR